jgi:hypothetical protein
LAEIWLDSSDRRAITEATDSINSLLSLCPHEQGEERDPATRILIVSPLAVVFEINEDDRRVTVLSIRHTPPDQQ